MNQDRIDLEGAVQVQSQDPIGVIAGLTAPTTGEVTPQTSVEIAWAMAH